MKALKIILSILLVLAVVVTAYVANLEFSWIELPFSLPFELPANMLWYAAGATGAILIALIVVCIVSAVKKKKKNDEEEDEEVEETESEEEIEELEEVEEAKDDATKENEVVEQAQESVEEEKEPEEASKTEEAKEEEPKAEEAEEPAAEEEAENTEEPQEEQKEEEETEEPKEEESMVAEENEELKAAPQAVEEAVEEKEEEPAIPEVQEETKEPEVKKEEPKTDVEAFISEQKVLNENIAKRLEGIDNSLKIIADALKALLYDTVPAGQTTIAVSTSDIHEAPAPVVQEEEPQAADGGDYFDQVEEDQKVEDQNAQIAEDYAAGWIATADQETRIKPKMSFEMRLRVADEDIKRFYSDIKNELLSYGIHDRISRHRENFNQGRINICRMVINGKTLKVYLAVDPESIDKRYFHHTDVGHRKGLVELPTMINVRSKVSARKVKELIVLMMESLVISKKPYEEHDFAKDLTAEGFTTVECKGYDYLVEKSMTLEKAKEYPDGFAAQLLEMVEDNDYQEKFIKTTLSVADLEKNFKDGDIVDIDKVRELGLGAKNSNFLSIKESKKMSKKLKVYANEYTPDAVKLICLCGGEAFLVIQPEKTIEEV